ncbi:MAG: hypothetical protein M1592_05365 [Candidatus Thermoplasmatota archaeon]|nr:hypothetical protein [Candidatus Thermoplasmatota archaeon]
MPDGSLFCQKCGSRLQQNAPDHAHQGVPVVSASATSSVFAQLERILVKSDVSAHSVKGLPGQISGEDNLLVVSPGPSVIMVRISSEPTSDTWEDMVRAKFRMGSDIGLAVIDDGVKLKDDVTIRTQLAKSGIFMVRKSALTEKVNGISANAGWQSIMDQIMNAAGISRYGDRMVYSMSQTRYSLIPDSVKDKLKKWMGRNNPP